MRPGRRPAHSGRPVGEIDWRQTIRRRLIVAGMLLALWATGIEARLVYLQIFQHDDLVARAERQQLRTIPIHPKRGEILDRDGRVLAYSVDADTIYAVPAAIDEAASTAAELCDALDACTAEHRATIERRLRQPRAFAYVRRQVSPDEARRVAELGREGVGFLKENRRYYPNKELAAHVLGYVGIDNQGLSGIESTYDDEISGRPGKVLIQTDARHQAFSRIERPPTAGATVELTIDKYLQHIAERELHAGVREHAATAGTLVMLDAHTGEVLALASEPTFNPNIFAEASQHARRNRAIQDIYEPGSTFKVVTAAAAFEEQVVQRDEPIDVSRGMIRFGRRQINDVDLYGTLSVTDVIVKSSNVGAIKIGLRLGPERLSRYVRRFGFGQVLTRDFPAESPGIVWNPSELDDSALASVAMGYQVSVTPLQMVAAVAAIANGGEVLEPRVVRAVIRNGVRAEVPRRVIRRAISVDTAAELTAIMEAVVERGTGRAAQIPGYTVAGKTGTSQKLIGGKYSNTNHIASFVGFVPSRAPVLTILVMIDTPGGDSFYGGAVAAPIFRRVAEAALRHLAVPPTVNRRSVALVSRQTEPIAVPASTRTQAPAVMNPADASSASGLMPDLRGLSAREALEVVGRLGVRVRLVGDGFVRRHDPDLGVPIDRGATATAWLQRYPPHPGSAQHATSGDVAAAHDDAP